jgi:hypothetical protein
MSYANNSSSQILRTLSENRPNRPTPITADSIAVDVHGSIITPVRKMLDSILMVNKFGSKDSNTKAKEEVAQILNKVQEILSGYGAKAMNISADSNSKVNEVQEDISTRNDKETTSSFRL